MVDTKDHDRAVRELTRVSFLMGFCIILAWSPEEAGRYLEVFKAFENKGAELIKERAAPTKMERIASALTAIKPVNKTDAMNLMAAFGVSLVPPATPADALLGRRWPVS